MTGAGSGHVAVIGAGIVGACTALALLDEGCRVTLLDPGPPGGEQAASYGNGAFISPASVVPMSMPGLWRKVPGFLLDPTGPLTIRWRNMPGLSPWLIRFLLAGATETKVRRTAGVLAGLLAPAPALHQELARANGCAGMIVQNGLLYAYPDRAAFAAEGLAWDLRRSTGLVWRELDEDALRAAEPTLGPGYRFGVLVESGAHCRQPGAYVAALVAAASARGAALEHRRVTGFETGQGRLQAVMTDIGPLACDHAVIAAGIGAAALVKLAGDRVPLVSERGYHVVLPGATGGPVHPTMPSDGRMANTPCADGLRAAGQVELASTHAVPDWRRADILLGNLKKTWPDLQYSELRRWMGHRPSTPDGLPVIGPARSIQGVIHAFGHGHIGLAAAPMTALSVAALLAGRAPPLDLRPFAAGRFRVIGRQT